MIRTLREPFSNTRVPTLRLDQIAEVGTGIRLMITGGSPPYQIAVSSVDPKHQREVLISTHPYIEYLLPGRYHVQIRDRQNNYLDEWFNYQI